MSDDLRNVIRQADAHIKQGEYRAAWELLLPYKDEPVARKRLVWLRNKRRAAAEQTTKRTSTRRTPFLLGIVLIIIIVLGAFLVLTSQNDDENPEPTSAANLDVTDTEGETTAAPDTTVDEVTATATATTPATETPVVTEDPQELSLQEQLEMWLLELEGVDSVISLDVDIPEDQPPLVYTELVVLPGNNNTAIPDAFMQHLNEVMDTTTYSDFVVILSDDEEVIEYILNIEDESWEETALN